MADKRRVGDKKMLPLLGFKLLDDDAPEGSFEARFAQLNVMDRDGDVIPTGAVGNQRVSISAWQHEHRQLPVGIGETFEEDGFAVVRGRFLTETTIGMDTYRTIKAMGDRTEWSFGFFVDAIEFRDFEGQPRVPHLTKLDIFEVSPVYRGAGIDTETTDIKSATDPTMMEGDMSEMEDRLATLVEAGQKAAEEQKATRELVEQLLAERNQGTASDAGALQGEAKDAPKPDAKDEDEEPSPKADEAPASAPPVPDAGPDLDTVYQRASAVEGVYDDAKLHTAYMDAVADGLSGKDFAGKIKSIRIVPDPTPAPHDEPQDFDIGALAMSMITRDHSLAEKEIRICQELAKEVGRPVPSAGWPIPKWALGAPTWTKADLKDVMTKAAGASVANEAGATLTPEMVMLTEQTPFDGLDLSGLIPVISAGPRERRIGRVTVPNPVMQAEPTGNTGYTVQSDPGANYFSLTPKTSTQHVPFTDQTIAMAGEFVSEVSRIMRINLDEFMYAQILNGDGTGNNVRGIYNYTAGAGQYANRDIPRSAASRTALSAVSRDEILNALDQTLGREGIYGRPSIICSRQGHAYLRNLVAVTGITRLWPELEERTERIVPTGALGDNFLAGAYAAKPVRMIIGPFGSVRHSVWGDAVYMRAWEETGDNVGTYRIFLRKWYDMQVIQHSLFYNVRQD